MKKYLPVLLASLIGNLLFSATVSAEPYLALRSNQKCSACHINPLGGGARSSFGSYYGSQILPANPGNQTLFDSGQVTETLRVGADLRMNMNLREYDSELVKSVQSFNTQSGQLYFTLQPKDSRFMLYFDEQVAPGGARNREAWVLSKIGKTNHYIKAGTIMLPFGYRFEDDSAFVRTNSNVTFDNNDTGVELGLEYAKGTINFAITNGTGGSNNDDTSFQFVSRGEFVINHFRVGASVILNDAEAGAQTVFGVFGGFNVYDFNVIGEFNTVEDESTPNALDNGNLIKQAALFEINRQVVKGYNVKLTLEYFDPDTELDEDYRSRTSFLVEATPWASVQIRAGVRIGEDIPQNLTGSYTEGFMQLHMYY